MKTTSALTQDLAEEQAAEIFCSLDVNENCLVTEEEFLAGCQAGLPCRPE